MFCIFELNKLNDFVMHSNILNISINLSLTGKAKEKAKSPRQSEKVEKKKGPDRNLKPNHKIKILEQDPFFETRSVSEFIHL